MSQARSRMRLLAVGLGALAISVPGLACGDDGGSSSSTASSSSTSGAAAPASGSVDTFDFGFDPADDTVEAGDTVTWENSGETIHTVKGDGFFSKAINPGDSYEHRFTKPGTYDYICTLHPDQMQGTIVVK